MEYLLSKLRIVARIIITMPSRIIFGNCIPIQKNIIPLFQSYFLKKIFYKDSNLEKKGILNIKYNLSKSIINETKEHFNHLIENENNEYSKSQKQKLLKNPIKLKNLKKITDIFDEQLKNYYQGNYKFISINAWRNYSDESKDTNWEKYIYSNYWHYDQYRTDILKIFILLNDDTNKDTGSTKAIDIQTSKKVSRNFMYLDTSLSNKKLDEYLKKNNLIYYCDGNMGDIFIINTSKCLHSASIPLKNYSRDLIQFETIKSNNNKDPFQEFLN